MLLCDNFVILLLKMIYSLLSEFKRKAENVHSFSKLFYFLMHINPLTICIY